MCVRVFLGSSLHLTSDDIMIDTGDKEERQLVGWARGERKEEKHETHKERLTS
jgi:hypothetical protein